MTSNTPALDQASMAATLAMGDFESQLAPKTFAFSEELLGRIAKTPILGDIGERTVLHMHALMLLSGRRMYAHYEIYITTFYDPKTMEKAIRKTFEVEGARVGYVQYHRSGDAHVFIEHPNGTVRYMNIFFEKENRTLTVTQRSTIADDTAIFDIYDAYYNRRSYAIHTVTMVEGKPKVVARSQIQGECPSVLDEYYPTITCGVEKLGRYYWNNEASILVLVGAKGSGKSKLSRWLACLPEKDIMVIPDLRVLGSGGITTFYESSCQALILEEANTIGRKREDGNDELGNILSHTNGVEAHEKKIIINANAMSFNSAKDDEAFWRTGRNLGLIKFRDLTYAESLAIFAKWNQESAASGKGNVVDAAVLESERSYTLADLFAYKRGEQDSEMDAILRADIGTSVSFGFGGR